MASDSSQPDRLAKTPAEEFHAMQDETFHSTQHLVRLPAKSVPPSLSRSWQPRFRVVGVLKPVKGAVGADEIRIGGDEIVVGRSGQASVRILDESVSRLHAKIVRKADEFVIEDLNSRNGTFVDGVPVASCVLRGGDAVQIGRNLFYFGRLMEPTDSYRG